MSTRCVMYWNAKIITRLVVVGLLYVSNIGFTNALAQPAARPFTVADEIGLTLFGTLSGGPPEIHFSPDGQYFAVWTEHGRLDLNRPEDSLRFYRSQDVETFLERSVGAQLPSPIWTLTLSSVKEGPIISNWRWLADSGAVAFLEATGGENKRLVLADLRKKTVEALTSTTEMVRAFDIRDRRHYVYMIADPVETQKREAEHRAPAIV